MINTSPNALNRAGAETSQRLLVHLKRVGAASTGELAQALEITPEAARLQIHKLAAMELLEGVSQPQDGPGRPRQAWQLTERGHARFPDAHAHLTTQLIGSIHALFGDTGLEQLIARREAEMQRHYEAALDDAPSLQVRLERLTALRAAEGYMARLERDGDAWLLIEDHCPICAAATACQGFCRSELHLFRQLLAPFAQVSREEHLLSGSRRCLYKITPLPASTLD